MVRKKEHLFDYLDSKNIEILALMRNHHTYSELLRKSALTPSNFSNRINRLIGFGLINIEYDMGKRRPKYRLTKLGEEILKHFEEMEKLIVECGS